MHRVPGKKPVLKIPVMPEEVRSSRISGTEDSAGNPYPDSKQEYKFVTNLDEIQKSIQSSASAII